ncbi:DNA sulfur modification protein DndB [Paenibacillus elgii]|uniref:DNA sulfur modification protein DndB n=1 Tax=Paenibacillus elgii TaxID=189691 RepID=UPI000248C6C2|nr:DNA sulfur modification protein DndB [Paenibacillus elgii]
MSTANAEQFDLNESLSLVFAELNKDKEQQREIDDILASHNIPRGTFLEILVNPERVELLEKDELCLLVASLYQVTNDERIRPTHFYNEKEINKAKKYKKKIDDSYTLPHLYERVLSGSDNDYMLKLSYQEIKKSWDEEFWTYNYETQRNPVKKTKKDGSIKLTPKVNKKSVKEIKELMIQGKYKPDVIVVNVLMDGSDEIFYNENDLELTIESASQINLIDGFHRVQAVFEALEENPELEGYLYVSIRNYDLETARYYLGQHNSFNTFDKTHIRELKSLNISDNVVTDLNTKSDLKGRIAKSTSVKHKFKEITNFKVLSDAIQDIFDPKTGKDRLDISYTLIRFFDYLLGSYEEAFVTNVAEVAKKSWINHHNTFVGYVVLAKKLFDKHGKDFPLDEIVRVVNGINFSKEGSEFNDLMTTQGKVNSYQVKRQIRNFFEDRVGQLLS